jgi:type II secretory pathway pseudopilin PulG
MIRDERGEFTLVGLLVATVVFGFVLMATYGAFDVFGRSVNDNQTRLESTDRVRVASDAMARQLRNLATPTALQPNAVILASANDIVFETVAPSGTAPAANPQNIEFVRYCLDAAARRLWFMELPPASVTGTTVPPASTGCPGGGWSNARVVASDLVNTYGGAARPVFSFDTTTTNLIRRVGIDLYVDTTPGKGSAEQQVSTGVNLRNQDAAPTASMTATPGATGILVLDGTASSDPDNDPLDYCWYDSAVTGSVGTCGPHSIGETPSFRYSYDTTAGVAHSVTLKVTDPSGLTSTSSPYPFST